MSSYRMKYKIGNTQYHIPVTDDMAGFGGGVPVGIILPYSSNSQNPPEGFLFCDGSAVSRAMYPDLFLVIGTIYGSGDGSTTFNLPNLVGGEFLEGASSAGTEKSAGLPNITGKFTARTYNSDSTATGAFTRSNNQWAAAISTSYEGPYLVEFDASRCSAVYGNSSTVQPKAVTVRYIIKAFDGQSQSSALIDVTQYASDLANKSSRGLDNLTQNGLDRFLGSDNFVIIYPDNGSESSPANITVDSRYVMDNPFPGYAVYCSVELKINNQWGETGWLYNESSGTSKAQGTAVHQFDNGSIVVQSANYLLMTYSRYTGNPFGITSTATSAPCRVKVWKIGKLPSQSS